MPITISTLLTLFVVPVFYVYVEQAGEAVGRLFSLARGRKARAAASSTDPIRDAVQRSR